MAEVDHAKVKVVGRQFMVSVALAMTGEPQHALCDLLNAAPAGSSSQIFSLTPMITRGPLKGKGALRKKINTISKRVL